MQFKRSIVTFIAISLLVPVLCTGAAAAQEAALEARCYSFVMNEATLGTGDWIYYTTYDGQNDVPLHDEIGGVWYVSLEMMPATLGSATYVADYFAVEYTGIYEYGAVTITAVNTDANQNGFPDCIEKSQGVQVTISGTATPHWNYDGVYFNTGIAGTMSRAAGSTTGTFSGSLLTSQGSTTCTGNWELLAGSGTITYATDTQSADMQMTMTGFGETNDFSGTATYTRNGTDQICVDEFTLENLSGGEDVVVYAAVLHRNGKYYRGNFQIDDGNDATSWRDYYNWQFEIYDTHDLDSDGIPDLSDPVYRVTASVDGTNGAVDPASVVVDAGESQTFTATPDSGYTVAAWKVNESVVQEGGTSYTLADVQADTTILVSFSRRATIAPWLPLLLDE